MNLSELVKNSLSEIKKGIDDFNLESEVDSSRSKAYYPQQIEFSLCLDDFDGKIDEESLLENKIVSEDSDRKISFFIDWRKF